MADLAKRSDIVFLSLSDDAALASVLDCLTGDGGAGLPGKITMDTSTVHPASSEKARARLAEKTAGNFMTAAMMEVVAEAHVLAEKTGLSSEAMESLIEHQYGPLALSMSKRLTTGAYMPAKCGRPWLDLDLALKDVGHGISCADEAGSALPVGQVALGHLQEAKRFSDVEGRRLDSLSMYGVLRRQAGLSFETDLVKQRDHVTE